MHGQGHHHIKLKRDQKHTGALMWDDDDDGGGYGDDGNLHNNLSFFVFLYFVFPKSRMRKTAAQKIQTRH